MKKAVAELSRASHKIAEEIYSKMSKGQEQHRKDDTGAKGRRRRQARGERWSKPSSRKWTRTRSNLRKTIPRG